MSVTATAINSAVIMDNHIPSRPKKTGKIITAAHSKTRVLKNEISAEVSPSLRAVKNAEPKIAKPAKKNEKAWTSNA